MATRTRVDRVGSAPSLPLGPMDEGPAATARAVLDALADLAPSTEQHAPGLAIPTDWFRWLPVESVGLFMSGPHVPTDGTGFRGVAQRYLASDQNEFRLVSIERDFGERLAAVDQIRAEQRSLRVGWLFVAGRTKTEDGRARRVFHPLVTIPVRVQRPPAFGGAWLVPAGDAEVTELVTDHTQRHAFESQIEFGGGALEGLSELEVPRALLSRLERLQRYARAVARAAGLPATKVDSARDGPDGYMRDEGLVIVAGVAVYAIREAGESSRASSLRAWSATSFPTWTAFQSLYVDDPPQATPGVGIDEPVESPYLLTPVQREAIAKSRDEPITLISGAPGTGKSHTIAAIACDALGRGERVLVAAKTDATVDALLDLLERGPGPEPVVFGSNERRDALAARLSAGQLQPASDDVIATARSQVESALSRREELWKRASAALSAELLLTETEPNEAEARAAAPGLFSPDTDLQAVEALLGVVTSSATGWRVRRRRRRALARLRALSLADLDGPLDAVRRALSLARTGRVARDLQATGGLDLAGVWPELLAADDEARDALGRLLASDSRSPRRLNRSTLPAVAALATALRSGRSARREQLRRLDDDKLTRALPLWVGTLADVDDLLPPVPGLFDLVILDEASSIDQPLAAATLLRGRRAVIAGDPRQLRQVSFVSDAQLQGVMQARGIDRDPSLAARLDVRRNSTFDVAAGASPVLVLDEHFRSDPHLVDFVARRIYDNRVMVATRSPRTQSRDCVDLIRTDGGRDKTGVVSAEVDRAVAEVRTLLRAGERSVGVVTPFRAQADALEEAMLAAFSADDLEALDLRVGTVHAFQGNERDTVIASFGVGPAEGASSWRFIEDPHLFAVFMTRARRRMILLLSADPPAGGLVASYLAQADAPPGPPNPASGLRRWTSTIADDLSNAGVALLRGYPTGRHIVDLCLADERRNVSIECEVHPEGPSAHIDRHLALARAGWAFVEAYRSRWEERQAELIVKLVGALQADSQLSGPSAPSAGRSGS
jgi:AAA domain